MKSAMSGCVHRGMRLRRCSGHCRMAHLGSSCAVPTKRIARRQHARAAFLWLHRTVPALEGGSTTIRPALGSRNQHDGYRLMVRRDGSRVRCFTRNGHDLADRFPEIADAASRILGIVITDRRRGGDRARRDVELPRAAEGCSRKTDAASHCTRVNLFREH
jgi:hypothetical protein